MSQILYFCYQCRNTTYIIMMLYHFKDTLRNTQIFTKRWYVIGMLYVSLVIIVWVVYDLIVTGPPCELYNLCLDTPSSSMWSVALVILLKGTFFNISKIRNKFKRHLINIKSYTRMRPWHGACTCKVSRKYSNVCSSYSAQTKRDGRTGRQMTDGRVPTVSIYYIVKPQPKEHTVREGAFCCPQIRIVFRVFKGHFKAISSNMNLWPWMKFKAQIKVTDLSFLCVS